MSLRDRLKRIRGLGSGGALRGGGAPPLRGAAEDREAGWSEGGTRNERSEFPADFPPPYPPDWESAGHQTLKRTVPAAEPILLPEPLPPALGIVAPDFSFLLGEGGVLRPEELLFFDLETTGLGGAGTVAFLAAFGRLEPAGPGRGGAAGKAYRLRVTQYLLLDYPGEGDFLEAVLAELGEGAPFLATYNGKSFDAQILRSRCLLNGIMPPAFRHADLLHPCRRLWKRVLPSCAQAQIEASILGLDRSGDVPGAMAPEIWFGFLKTGDFSALGGIADHNVRDISGLARIFAVLAEIAAAPLAAGERYQCDLERLALHWQRVVRRLPAPDGSAAPAGEALLEAAAKKGWPRAAYVFAGDLFHQDRPEEGRRLLEALIRAAPAPVLRALACRLLSVDAERRLGDPALALAHTDAALLFADGGGVSLLNGLKSRRARLLEKIEKARGKEGPDA